MKPRVVIDTNVWISGIFWKGSTPYNIVKKVRRSEIIAFFSDETFSEWDEKVREKAISFGLTEEYLVFRKNLLKVAVFVYPREKVEICRDPDDNKFLEAAIAAEANFLISGDKDLLSLEKIKISRIITPHQFLKLFP